jgi:hypothetical protein
MPFAVLHARRVATVDRAGLFTLFDIGDSAFCTPGALARPTLLPLASMQLAGVPVSICASPEHGELFVACNSGAITRLRVLVCPCASLTLLCAAERATSAPWSTQEPLSSSPCNAALDGDVQLRLLGLPMARQAAILGLMTTLCCARCRSSSWRQARQITFGTLSSSL